MNSFIVDKDGAWKNVLGKIRLNVSDGTFKTFLYGLSAGEIRDVDDERQLFEIYCPNLFVRNTVEQRFWMQIKTALDEATGKKNELVFTVRANTETTSVAKGKNSLPSELPIFEEKPDETAGERIRRAGLNTFYSFSNFAVSSSNQMAHAAALAVSDKPGAAYNPLFLWGGVGVGKTHLMQAVGIEALKKGEVKVVYSPGEDFTNDIVAGIKSGGMERVRSKYRKVELLLLDDIQFIAGKETSQEEFFHTFNAIQRAGGQIVLTSDRPPHEISKLEDRLKSRFEAGLIVDISPPDMELRSAITLIKAEQKGLTIDTELAQAIAARANSARKIEGVLTKLLTMAGIEKREVDLEMVEQVLGHGEGAETAKVITPATVMDSVALGFGVSVSAIKGGRRTASIVVPRMVLMYLLREDLKLPFEEVGRIVGGRDHSTVIHAVGKIGKQIETDTTLRQSINSVRKRVFGNSGGQGGDNFFAFGG